MKTSSSSEESRLFPLLSWDIMEESDPRREDKLAGGLKAYDGLEVILLWLLIASRL